MCDDGVLGITIVGTLVSLVVFIVWFFSVILPSTFSCNEIVTGSMVSISHLPTPSLEPPLCDVQVQTKYWNDTISSMPCAPVQRCDLNLSACSNLQISVNHYNRDRCMHLVLGPWDLLDSFTVPYETIDWWWQFCEHALVVVLLLQTAVLVIGIAVIQLDKYSDAFKPWFPPAGEAGSIDTELAVEKASLMKGPGPGNC